MRYGDRQKTSRVQIGCEAALIYAALTAWFMNGEILIPATHEPSLPTAQSAVGEKGHEWKGGSRSEKRSDVQNWPVPGPYVIIY